MPETLFGTLGNLLYSVQKNLLVRTVIIQKPVKWICNAKQSAGSQTVHIFSERYFQTGISLFPANVPFK